MDSDRHSDRLASSFPRWTSVVLFLLFGLIATIAVAGLPDGRDDELGDPPRNPAAMALDFYQHHLSSLRHARCPFQPSCSEYARQAIAQYGLFSGVARAADRLMRCNGSAGRFYGRADSGGLDDPAWGASHGPVVPRLEPWLLPAFDMEPPMPAAESVSSELWVRIGETVSFARWLAVGGDCRRAETEYLRVAHLSRSDDWRRWSYYQIGASYFEAGAWTDAESAYLQAGMLSADAAQRELARHLVAASLFNDGRYGGSEDMLYGPDLMPRALALRGLCRMTWGDWDAAASDFAAGVEPAVDSVLIERLEYMRTAAAAGAYLPHRSPGLAMVMSAVLPGSGQMYAGRTHDGLRHLLFNGALIYTLVKLIQDDHYPASYLVGTIGVPFYVGNVRGGGYSARAFNRDRRLEHVADVIAEIGGIHP